MTPVLQPHIPHYRLDFFNGLENALDTKLFCYENTHSAKNGNFSQSEIQTHQLKNIMIGPFLTYSPFPFLQSNTQMVLMLNITHLTTWGLLLTKFIHRRKIILWGHGISVKRYLKEEKKSSFLMKLMIRFADVVWFYTEKEKTLWEKYFPKKAFVSLNNTISNVDGILSYESEDSVSNLKVKYNIKQEKCFIFCARFDNPHRRIDLLEKIIETADKRFGFIIIGEGKFKPDFSHFDNVYDFGSVYDTCVKNDLFSIADIYLQPGWVGLSIVEAMAYGLPVFTFVRSDQTLQCVEYSYLVNDYNAMLFSDLDEFKCKVSALTDDDINVLGQHAKRFVMEELQMHSMVCNAVNSIKGI